MRKHFYLCVVGMLCAVASHSQQTPAIYNAPQLVRGFYTSYQEYLRNAPSVQETFTSHNYAVLNGNDSIFTGAAVKLKDGKNIRAIWGFCDGDAVFVSMHISLFRKRLLRLQYIGKNPFLLSWHKDIYKIDPREKLPYYHLMFVNDEGKIKKATVKNLLRLFAADEPLLKRFRVERDYSNAVKTKYLVLFNENMMSPE